MKRILVSGLPRSGTTWISRVLSYNKVKYIHEPDNKHQNLFDIIYKDTADRFPYLPQDDNNPKYKRLFEKAYSGYYLKPYDKPSNIVRDLFSLDLEELEQRVRADEKYPELHDDALSYLREYLLRGAIHAASYFSKFRSLASGDYEVELVKSVHCVMALDFLNNELDISKTLLIFRHPASIVASHLLMDSKTIWWLYEVKRIADEQITKWKKELSPSQITSIEQGYRIFPLDLQYSFT